MISFLPRKIGTIDTGKGFAVLISFHFIGMFFGCMASSSLFAEYVNSSVGVRVFVDLAFILLQLFLATSYIGLCFVPMVAAIRGFIFSASLASILFFTGVTSFLAAIAKEAIPSLIFLPSFLFVSRYAIRCSLGIARPSYKWRHEKSKTISCLVLSLISLVFEFIYCLVIFPLFD